MGEYHTSGGAPQERSTTDVTRQEARNVSESATQAAGQVAQTAKEQAREVTVEAGRRARDLVGEARTQARDQAGKQRERAVGGLRALGDELDQMAERGGQSGLATEIARQLSSRSRQVARFLDEREPGDLLEEVRSFARRRSGVFLAGTALAGVAVGRLTRTAVSQSSERQQPRPMATDATSLPPDRTGQYGVPTSGEPVYPTATPGDPAHSAATAGGSAPGEPASGEPASGEPGYGEPGYGEPGYGQARQARQGRTP